MRLEISRKIKFGDAGLCLITLREKGIHQKHADKSSNAINKGIPEPEASNSLHADRRKRLHSHQSDVIQSIL